MARRVRIIVAVLLIGAAAWNAKGNAWGLSGRVEFNVYCHEIQYPQEGA